MKMRCEDAPTFRKWLVIVALFVFCVGFQVLLFAAGGAVSSQPRIGKLDDWYPPNIPNMRTIELDIGAPILIKASDFNEDGKTDLIIASNRSSNGHYQYKIYLLSGQGKGKFGEPLPVAQGPVLDDGGRIGSGIGVVTDLDGDGHLDFIGFFGSYESPLSINPSDSSLLMKTIKNQFFVLWGNGDGTFQEQQLDVYQERFGPPNLAIGDFDGDGHPDIAYSDWQHLCINVIYNKGHRVLEEPQTIKVENRYHCVAVPLDLLAADLNHDGKEDIIVGGSCAFDEKGSRHKQYKRFIKVLLSKGKGSFQQSTVYISAVPDLEAFAPALWAGDLDWDGDVDLIFTEPFKTQTPGEIAVNPRWVERIEMLKGKGDGTFVEPPRLLSFAWPIGFLDLRTGVSGELTFIYISNGEIGIAQGVPPSLGGGTLLDDVTDAVVTDVDNDGWAEIVAVAPVFKKKATNGPVTEYQAQSTKILILGRKGR